MGDILKVWDEENSIWIPIPAIQGAQGPQGPKGDKGDTGDFSPLDAYPVGAFYISEVSTSPAELFGGSWTQITGQFLFATDTTENNPGVYAAGSTGGAATVTLTANQSGQRALTISGGGHTHTVKSKTLTGYQSGSNRAGYNATGSGGGALDPGIDANTGTHSHSVSAASASEAHENMPPYLAVYVWKRVS